MSFETWTFSVLQSSDSELRNHPLQLFGLLMEVPLLTSTKSGDYEVVN